MTAQQPHGLPARRTGLPREGKTGAERYNGIPNIEKLAQTPKGFRNPLTRSVLEEMELDVH